MSQLQVVEYQDAWPTQFQHVAAELRPVFAPGAATVEHIGSTAVPGLAAKPVIDIMAPVHTLAASRPAIEAARELGYVHYPYKPDVMHWFCKPSAAHRTHHLHLVPLGSPLWRERLAFRDALRADPELRASYQALKLDLAQRHRLVREAYTDAKTPFIEQVLRQAARP